MKSPEIDEDLREFLIESSENLANLDREIVQLEQTPGDIALVSSVFRTIHSIKGTCGFFGFDRLGSLAHITENILSQVRERKRVLTPELISIILEAVDEIKIMLASIESAGNEGEERTVSLRARLNATHKEVDTPAAAPIAPTPAPVAAAPALPPAAPPPAAPEVPPSSPAPATASIPPPAKKPAPPAADGEANLADSTIRVDVKLLNKLMNLVGELVLARNQLLQDPSLPNSSLHRTSQRLNLITSELQEGVMKTRMQPIGVVWNKLPRVVRDLASKCGKSVQIEMEGAGTELDKTILEAIKDPLTHIVRNSCDHGIETPSVRIAKNKNPEGLLLLRAYHEGGVVNIEISDDGAGVDPERVKAKAVEKDLIRPDQAAQMSVHDAIQLIFLPGFSTAAQVTSISGRGVGMDVVKTNIEKIGGHVEVMNRPESGTIIRIKIPLTLAIIPGLIVKLDAQSPATALDRVQDDISVRRSAEVTQQRRRSGREERFVIPQANLLELVRLEGKTGLDRIESVHGTPIFHHRGKLLPLAYLGKVLGRAPDLTPREVVNIVVLQAENQQMGLVVDHICDTQEIVVKPLGKQLKALSCYVGATIMDDGRPALILDVMGLAKLSGLRGQSRPAAAQQNVAASIPAVRQQMLLLFQAGRFDRLAVPLSLVARLEEISADQIERAAGRLVLFYRGDILPLISLAHVLDPSQGEVGPLTGTIQIVVFTNGPRRIGVIVDQILDIVKEAITIKRSSPVRGLLGSAVITGKVTDLIDLHALVETTGENWLDRAQTMKQATRTVLLVDPSPVGREMLQEFLDVSGYTVLQAGSLQEALPKARQNPIDLVITAVDMPGSGGSGRDLADAMHKEDMLQHIPVLGLFDRADQIVDGELAMGPFDAHLVRSDRARLLGILADLMLKSPALAEAIR